MLRIGYVSAVDEQDRLAQVEALKGAGVSVVRVEDASGPGGGDHPTLSNVIAFAAPGDSLCVTRPDCLANSVQDMLRLVRGAASRGVEICILQPSPSTIVPEDRSFLAGLELAVAMQPAQTAERIAAAGALPKKLVQKIQMNELLDRGYSVRETAQIMGVTRMTVYRRIRDNRWVLEGAEAAGQGAAAGGKPHATRPRVRGPGPEAPAEDPKA